jgi:phage replication O-like protein O
MSDAPSKIIPNTFQTPNLLTDDGLMALLSGNEIKCYIVVIRKTFGWRKDRDRIAKSQIVAITGISDTTVDDCMAALVRYGLVVCTAENNAANAGKEWAPQIDDSLIDYAGLQTRQAAAKQASVRRTEKARKVKGGVVQQPHLVQQPQGGVVQQPPQQPITANDSVVVVNAGDIAKIYEREIGALTLLISDALHDACREYPIDWIPEAIVIAVKRNVRKWDYVEGILKKCKDAGKRPSLNKLEAKNGNTSGNSGKQKNKNTSWNVRGAKNKRADTEYSPADLAAADLINQHV